MSCERGKGGAGRSMVSRNRLESGSGRAGPDWPRGVGKDVPIESREPYLVEGKREEGPEKEGEKRTIPG